MPHYLCKRKLMWDECCELALMFARPWQDGWVVETTSGTVFDDVDLSSGEWVEYDEKLGESVGVYGLESEFKVHKGK